MRRASRPMFGLVAAAALLAAAALALAVDVVVKLKDGRQLVGAIRSESPEVLTLNIGGVAVEVSKADLESIKPVTPLRADFTRRRAVLKADDLEGRYSLALWAVERAGKLKAGDEALDAYELALGELTELVAADPRSERFALRKSQVERTIEAVKSLGQGGGASGTSGTTTAPAPQVRAGVELQLTEAQVAVIRAYETDPTAARKPRARIPRETSEAMVSRYPGVVGGVDAATFRAADPWVQIEAMKAAGAKDLLATVQFSDDPESLKVFRNAIHPSHVLNYCATAECHGGPASGKLFLFRAGPHSERTIYSNFHILARAATEAGDRLIDRDKPERSLLVQYALPQAVADLKHPEVKGFKPRLADKRAAGYKQLVEWIGKLRPYLATSYTLDYTPPGPGGQPPKPEEPKKAPEAPGEADAGAAGAPAAGVTAP